MEEINFKSKIWVYPGFAAWRFLSLPAKESAALKKMFEGLTRGFGSLKVEAQIGRSNWKTSIFPDKKRGCYLLPLKAEIRKKENLQDKSTVTVKLKILV